MSQVKEEFPQVAGITTSVIKCGDVTKNKTLALIIPGNPGVSQYYNEFMHVLNKESGRRLPVWCVSHGGHGHVPNYTTTSSHEDSFGLQGQIHHKLSFVKEHVPSDTRLILIGHSIGCYIILHMLKDLDPTRVVKCLMLFPTIERMGLSPKGRSATPLLRYLRWMTPFPMYPVYLIPNSIKEGILRWYFKGRSVPESAVEATKRLANPFSISNVTHMANQEMQTVIGADYDIIEKNMDKLMFHYGARDHWCPVEYYEDMKAKYPNADIQLCTRGFAHAFVLEDSRGMAELLWPWLVANVKHISNGL